MGVLTKTADPERGRPPRPVLPDVEVGAASSTPAGRKPGSKTAVEADDLSLWYGAHQVLKSVRLSIPDLEITAIIGPSGCGKSSLLRCFNRMNDLFPPVRYQGSVLFDGVDVLRGGID